MNRPSVNAMREICQRLRFGAVPDEWEDDHRDPERIDEFIALYWEHRNNPNGWFRDLLGKLILETTEAAVFDGKADSTFLAKVRQFLEAVAPEQQENLRIWVQSWSSEEDELRRLLPPLFADLLRNPT